MFVPNKYEIAGFQLYGHKQPDGKIKLGSGRIVDEFPKEAEVCGTVYTLEFVTYNSDGKSEEELSTWSESSKSACWGDYV
jgi:hypothetical protein